MNTYQVCLSPIAGTRGENFTVTVMAYSEGEASRIVGNQNPGYTVEAIFRRS
jgi:hypothetical protein